MGKGKTIVKIIAAIPFMGINWAALYDITSGEPNPYMEYSVIIASLGLVIFLLINRYIKLKSRRV